MIESLLPTTPDDPRFVRQLDRAMETILEHEARNDHDYNVQLSLLGGYLLYDPKTTMVECDAEITFTYQQLLELGGKPTEFLISVRKAWCGCEEEEESLLASTLLGLGLGLLCWIVGAAGDCIFNVGYKVINDKVLLLQVRWGEYAELVEITLT